MKNFDCSDYVRVKIGWNAEKSPGHLKRLDVAQTLVRASVKNSKRIR